MGEPHSLPCARGALHYWEPIVAVKCLGQPPQCMWAEYALVQVLALTCVHVCAVVADPQQTLTAPRNLPPYRGIPRIGPFLIAKYNCMCSVLYRPAARQLVFALVIHEPRTQKLPTPTTGTLLYSRTAQMSVMISSHEGCAAMLATDPTRL